MKALQNVLLVTVVFTAFADNTGTIFYVNQSDAVQQCVDAGCCRNVFLPYQRGKIRG